MEFLLKQGLPLSHVNKVRLESCYHVLYMSLTLSLFHCAIFIHYLLVVMNKFQWSLDLFALAKSSYMNTIKWTFKVKSISFNKLLVLDWCVILLAIPFVNFIRVSTEFMHIMHIMCIRCILLWRASIISSTCNYVYVHVHATSVFVDVNVVV